MSPSAPFVQFQDSLDPRHRAAVPGSIRRLGGRLGLDEEFGCPADAEVVVGTAFRLVDFHDHGALVMEPACLVFNVPAERLGERCDEVEASLGLGVGFREVVNFVGLEFPNKFLEIIASDF